MGDSFTAAFSRPGWFLASIDAFQPGKIVVITWRGRETVWSGGPSARPYPNRCARALLSTLVTPPARGDYNAPIVHPEFAAVALPAMLDRAFKYFGKRGVYWFPNIPESDPSLEILRSFFRRRACRGWKSGNRRRGFG